MIVARLPLVTTPVFCHDSVAEWFEGNCWHYKTELFIIGFPDHKMLNVASYSYKKTDRTDKEPEKIVKFEAGVEYRLESVDKALKNLI